MEELNQALYLMLNAPSHPNVLVLAIAHGLAEWLIWLVPLTLSLGWLRGDDKLRMVMLGATLSGLFGLLINQVIGLLWQHPRPFKIGLGHTFLAHSPDSSFPSDHLTLLWAVAFTLFVHNRSRPAGLLLALLGLPLAWSRVYLGIHFPLDMAGAALVAFASSQMVLSDKFCLTELIYPPVIGVYRFLAAPLMRRG